MKNTPLFVLGSSDPEMKEIEAVLDGAGLGYVHAAVSGSRVHPGNAYRTTGLMTRNSTRFTRRRIPVNAVVMVECGFEDGKNPYPKASVITIDHHREGDPGYGLPPEEYWQGSSLGQLCEYLMPSISVLKGMKTSRRMMIAAADHCLAAAYRGLCPGVRPWLLGDWRIESRAEFQHRTPDAVRGDIEHASRQLREARMVSIGGVYVADLRGAGHIQELPEAAVRIGVPFLATMEDKDSRVKTILQAAPPEAIETFLTQWCFPTGRLVDPYGSPARGFAGGYIGDGGTTLRVLSEGSPEQPGTYICSLCGSKFGIHVQEYDVGGFLNGPYHPCPECGRRKAAMVEAMAKAGPGGTLQAPAKVPDDITIRHSPRGQVICQRCGDIEATWRGSPPDGGRDLYLCYQCARWDDESYNEFNGWSVMICQVEGFRA